jgi:riboflavin-specific deaminase-like protein
LTVKSSALRAKRKAAGLAENPAKVAVVSLANLKLDGSFMTVGPALRLVYTTSRTPAEQINHLEDAGAKVFVLGELRVDLLAVMESLYGQGFRNLLVEGGGTIIAEFFRLDLVDELSLYIAPHIFGGASAPTLADGPGLLTEQAPTLRLDSLEKFDEAGGLLVHYGIEHKNQVQ